MVHDLLTDTHDTLEHTAGVTSKIRHTGGEETLAGLGQKIGFFNDTFGGVDVRQVQGGPRVTSEKGSAGESQMRRLVRLTNRRWQSDDNRREEGGP